MFGRLVFYIVKRNKIVFRVHLLGRRAGKPGEIILLRVLGYYE
jgi:hypothetical protein